MCWSGWEGPEKIIEVYSDVRRNHSATVEEMRAKGWQNAYKEAICWSGGGSLEKEREKNAVWNDLKVDDAEQAVVKRLQNGRMMTKAMWNACKVKTKTCWSGAGRPEKRAAACSDLRADPMIAGPKGKAAAFTTPSRSPSSLPGAPHSSIEATWMQNCPFHFTALLFASTSLPPDPSPPPSRLY